MGTSFPHQPLFDLLLDLSNSDLETGAVDEHIRLILRDGELSSVVGSIRVALPPRADSAAISREYLTDRHGAMLLRTAINSAARFRRPLLVLSGKIFVDSAALIAMLDALGAEPLIGSVQPRFADSTTDYIYALPNPGDSRDTPPLTPRRVLAHLPSSIVTPELAAACILLRHELAGTIDVPDDISSLSGALAFCLCQARRCGFRNQILNQIIVPTTLSNEHIYPQLASHDAARLLQIYPDTFRAASETAALPQRRLETLMGAIWPPSGGQKSLLIDCRGLAPLFNGTSVCMCGLLDGMAAVNREWHIDILCSAEAAEFHGLAWRYPGFTLLHGEPVGVYAAALMPNQPWETSVVKSLHRHALVMVFNILDTIAWDILYPASDRVAPTWRLIGRHADGLAFISRFSQERFQTRFPTSASVVKTVARLTLRADDLTLPACCDLAEGNHVLLFGNDYDHKALAPTLNVLREGFPLQPIVVFGGRESTDPLIRTVPSGDTDNVELHRLIATARAIIYPSFYEGFGLPVAEGLAYGRPVIVRRSPLWEEIGAHARLPGRLLPFDDSISLVDVLGRVLEDLPIAEIRMGTCLSPEEPAGGWKECADRLLALLNQCLANVSAERWMHRDEVLEC
ncbi:glycosyltransferase [Rhizobium rhizogenes]|nr:glycosyltransferase family 4 protein [Rhizobium rhizogenes]NTH33452.1 glycosyltransferase family 4 protein [Rhizobium rhizogenes]